MAKKVIVRIEIDEDAYIAAKAIGEVYSETFDQYVERRIVEDELTDL